MIEHSVGAIELLRSILPDVVEVAFAGITLLGDPWALVVVVLLVYWFVDREKGLQIVGLALGASGLVIALKVTFALARPTVGPPVDPASIPTLFRSIYVGEVTPDGYAFPSGHALGSTVTWGSLALFVKVHRRRDQLLAAGTLIALIALSRVVLGVHFLVDVVAGVAIGVAFLAIVITAVDRASIDPATGYLGIGLALGLAALAATGFGEDAQIVVGTAVAGLASTRLSIPETPWPTSPVGVTYALAGLVGFGVVAAAGKLLAVPGIVLVTMILAGGVAFAWPLATARFEAGRTKTGTRDSTSGRS